MGKKSASKSVKKSNSKKSKGIVRRNIKEKKNPIYRSKTFWIIISVLVLLLFYLITNFYLYFKFAIGNDVLVKLNPENKDIYLKNGEVASVDFDSSIVSNPFCSVSCAYTFSDLSSGEVIDSGEFFMKSLVPFSNSYNLTAPLTGSGQMIYRFNMECYGEESFLCYTSGRVRRKTAIISLNYDLNEENEYLKGEIESIFYNLSRGVNFYSNNLNVYSDVVSENDFIGDKKDDVVYLNTAFYGLNNSLKNFSSEYNDMDYYSLYDEILALRESFNLMENDYFNLSREIALEVERYNSVVLEMYNLSSDISFLQLLNVTSDGAQLIDGLVFDYNSRVLDFSNISNVSLLEQRIDFLRRGYLIVMQNVTSGSELNLSYGFSSSVSLLDFNLSVVDFSLVNSSFGYSLEENEPRCCLLGSCESCCDLTCNSNKSLYPIIFIHGHDFSSGISAEYNLDVFGDIQRNLEEILGIYNFGSFLTNVPYSVNSSWQSIFFPISVRSSYYYDYISSGDEFDILETKKDNIDSYAIRLRSIVESVKARTGREKVVLISHSMGGLVIRRYLQVFGEDDVDFVILVASPNHGISGSVRDYCDFFGATAECNDMDSESVFIGKVNSYVPSISVYNIIGVGCDMDGEDGDGVVTNKSAFLSWAKNFYYEGECDSLTFDYLHNSLLVEEKNPDFSFLVAEILSDEREVL